MADDPPMQEIVNVISGLREANKPCMNHAVNDGSMAYNGFYIKR